MVKYKMLMMSMVVDGLMSTSFLSQAEPGRGYDRQKIK